MSRAGQLTILKHWIIENQWPDMPHVEISVTICELMQPTWDIKQRLKKKTWSDRQHYCNALGQNFEWWTAEAPKCDDSIPWWRKILHRLKSGPISIRQALTGSFPWFESPLRSYLWNVLCVFYVSCFFLYKSKTCFNGTLPGPISWVNLDLDPIFTYGDFHKWGYPTSWMVNFMENPI